MSGQLRLLWILWTLSVNSQLLGGRKCYRIRFRNLC